MRKFSRFFIFLLFTGLFTAYAPMTQADMQQGYGNMPYTPITQIDEPLEQASYGRKIGKKALSGWTNLSLGILEIPKNIINTTNKSNIFYGIVGGLFKGLVNTAGRMGVGVADLITFPLPTKPIASPLFIWDDFDVDTTYGPVFRLYKNQETVSPVVQAPSVEPVVAAPAVVTPKPEAIDNSKQYSQETNHKLDTVFKKEMMK